MLLILDKTHVRKVALFARKNGKMDNFVEQLLFLRDYAGKENTRCKLMKDGEFDFYFVMEKKDKYGIYKTWFNGGMLFHGQHDGFGSGSGPTFAVTLNPTDGWSIHT